MDNLAAQLLAGGNLVDPEPAVSATLVAVGRAMTQLLVFDHAQDLVDRADATAGPASRRAVRDSPELALQFATEPSWPLDTGSRPRRSGGVRSAPWSWRWGSSPVLTCTPRSTVATCALLMARRLPRSSSPTIFSTTRPARTWPDQRAVRALGRLGRGSVCACLGEAEAAVAELLQALRLVDGAGGAVGRRVRRSGRTHSDVPVPCARCGRTQGRRPPGCRRDGTPGPAVGPGDAATPWPPGG